MDSLMRCLKDIEKIRRVVSGADVAYVARSRISRLILNVSRMAAQRVGAPVPQRLAVRDLPAEGDSSSETVHDACMRLLDVSKSITQPSEPLDDRWRHGWAALMKELDNLERQLQTLGGAKLTLTATDERR
ncbi:hypothetical protein MYX84_12035 [Acidobacteria bacterium AH-259-O06]|nr:hypothetical protein [Acidobacteria bacterium AH-259-O06]